MDAQSFQQSASLYSPLPPRYIRLLCLFPGDIDDPIQCTLTTVLLPLQPPLPAYDALSYCWGDAKDTVFITCNGYQFPVTKNLNGALHRLRRKDEPLTLWVDAVCIDQSNHLERAQQVSMMKDVYASAEMVYSWLGEPSEDTDRGMRLLLTAAERSSMPQLETDTGEVSVMIILSTFPYMTRVWVVQENVVARQCTVICGDFSVPLADFLDGFQAYNEMARTSQYLLSQVVFGNIRELRRGFAGESISRLYLLQQFRNFEATDPRDKLYALYGLLGLETARPENNSLLSLNYDRPLQEVYLNFAIYMLTSSQSLDLLSVPRELSDPNLPSWAPDWNFSSIDPSWLPQVEDSASNDHHISKHGWKGQRWRAAGGSVASPMFADGGRTLGLRGHIVDEILEKGTGMSLAPFPQTHILDEWESWLRPFDDRRYPPTGENVTDAYMRTLITGNYLPEEESQLSTQFLAARGQHPTLSAEDGAEFYERMMCKMRSLALTKNGHYALVSRYSYPGDPIAVFEGGKAPLVIRRSPDDPEKWDFIADIYVHGIMQGEAFEEGKCEMMWFK